MRLGRVLFAAALFVGLNVAYAIALPDVLSATSPAMPHGYREAESPITEARATFVPVEPGIPFVRYAWSGGALPYPAVMTGGVAAADFDEDGFVDLYFPPGGPEHPAALYRNLGNWSFEDVTEAANLSAVGFGSGAAFGDFDNDGDADLYTSIDGVGHFYVQDAPGEFAERAGEHGIDLRGACGARPCQPSSVAWLDHDNDGDLDLLIVNNLDWRMPGLHTSGEDYASLIYFAPRQSNLLFENTGNGFVDATVKAAFSDSGKGLGVAIADLDANGWPDVATANDITENGLLMNTEGVFRDEARQREANEVKTSMGIAAADLDEDGRPDLVVSNFRKDKLSLLMQRPDGTFAYETEARGLGASWRGTGWGVALFDYDLDGWLDIAHAVGRAVPLEPHRRDLENILFPELLEDAEDQLYRNLGGQFAEATASAGGFAGRTNTRAILAVDLDNDGDEDIVRVNVQGDRAELLRNDRLDPHGSIQLRLEGRESNRDGYGARIAATLPDGRTLVREHSSSAGFQTGLSPVITLGLGAHETASVVVTWPSGLVQDLGTLSRGAHRVVENA